MIAVDVGANVGSITSQLLHAGATVIAIDPHAEALEALRRAYPTATTLHAAVTDRDGTVTYYHSKASVHGSLYRANLLDDIGRMEEVPAVTLDQACPLADIVKIDAQGAEAAILRGASQVLARRQAVFFIELWRQGLEAAGESVATVRRLFEAQGYVPQGQTWDTVQRQAEAQQGHSALDVVVIPGG